MEAALHLIMKRNRFSCERWSLLHLIGTARCLLATRSRDHMFAFLGLASDAQNPAFDPDYERPLHLVVLKYAREFVRMGDGPQMLYSAGLGHCDSEFPSWVPDWTKITSFFLGEYVKTPYRTAGNSVPHMKVVDMENTLVVRGLTFDTIIRLSHCEDNFTARSETGYQLLLDLLEECDRMLTDIILYPTGEDLHEVYWRTLIGNISNPYESGRDILEAPHSYAKQYDRWRDFVQKKAKNHYRTDEDELTVPQISTFKHLAERMMNYGSRFCVTEKGYVGFCEKSTQCGDVIAIFLGCRVPYIIRKCDERENHFRLIGKSYIHGIMKGEALSAEGVREEDLMLW